MPRIGFSFSGWCRVNVSTATDASGNDVDVSKMDGDELSRRLEEGELFVSLNECLDDSSKSECEISDFEAE